MLRWFEKFQWQVGNQPVCVGETGKSPTSTKRHGGVSDIADKSTGVSQGCRERHGEVGVVESGLKQLK